MLKLLRECVYDARTSFSLRFPSLGFYLLHDLLEVYTKQPLEEEVDVLFTHPQDLQCGLVGFIRIDQNGYWKYSFWTKKRYGHNALPSW